MKDNPIPADRAAWGRLNALDDRNNETLRKILESSAAERASRTADEQKIGDYYATCMDVAAIDAKGAAPLKPDMDRIDAIQGKTEIPAELIRLHRRGVNVFFSLDSEQDFKNSTEYIAGVGQGGLGLPDRDYYFKDDPKSAEIRAGYVTHMRKMFELLGDAPERARAESKAVMAVETDLAKGALDLVSRRDPSKIYHKMTVHELFSLAPFLTWEKYFEGVGAPPVQSLNVSEPNFFRQLESAFVQTSLDDLKAYMRWRIVHDAAPRLAREFVDENFSFYGKTLTGAKELRPRWKRCVTWVDGELGEALGRKYVDVTFGAEGKQRTLKMVGAIEKAMNDDLKTLDWMTPATRKEAFVKLKAIENKIGYPDKWRDYSTVKIVRGDVMGNYQRASEFENLRQLGKIGKPIDRGEWGMTPPTINAYYDPQMNNINFPAGILQPPVFSKDVDDAVNFGSIGSIVGHELTHGFDDEGRQFDPKGNLRDWWTPEDAKEFEKRADCFVQEYSAFKAVDDIHLDGKLTLGENTADNGGLRLAYMALMGSLEHMQKKKLDGFTPEQRFFLGFGQVWCQNERSEVARLQATTDPHSLDKYRVNGTVSNMPEFQQAFACNAAQPMVRHPACRVW